MNKLPKKLSSKRKAEVEEMALWPVEDYFPGDELIKPETIADAEGITYNIKKYNGTFKGLINCTDNQFHIFINAEDNENHASPQVRFSFAHELGHYFIDSHRIELLNKGMLPAESGNPFLAETIFEKEAEFFAGCMLMPRCRMMPYLDYDYFSIDHILNICNTFQVSLTAALFRYIAIGKIPIMVLFSFTDGTFLYKKSTDKFPFYTLNLSADNMVPVGSKAYDLVTGMDKDLTRPKEIAANVWFRPKTEEKALLVFNEYCFLQPSFAKVVSVIWEVKS